MPKTGIYTSMYGTHPATYKKFPPQLGWKRAVKVASYIDFIFFPANRSENPRLLRGRWHHCRY